MTDAELAALAGAAPAADDKPKMLMIQDDFDPAALSGTANARFADRLAYQVATCQALPSSFGEARQVELATSAVAALKELAPVGAAEGLLAAQMVAAHNASLELLARAMGESSTARAIEDRGAHAPVCAALGGVRRLWREHRPSQFRADARQRSRRGLCLALRRLHPRRQGAGLPGDRRQHRGRAAP